MFHVPRLADHDGRRSRYHAPVRRLAGSLLAFAFLGYGLALGLDNGRTEDRPVVDVAAFSDHAAGDPLPDAWRHFELPHVQRPTHWQLVADDGDVVLSATADGGASMVYTSLDLDPQHFRRLSWRWKVATTRTGARLDCKHHDDAAARVYVGFRWDPALSGPWQDVVGGWQRWRYRMAARKLGEMPPFAAVVYTWADAEPVGWTGANPRFQRAVQVVLRSAEDPLGEWAEESRDVVDDFRAWFGFDPPPISHVALLADADDLGGHLEARFGDITLAAAPETRPVHKDTKTRRQDEVDNQAQEDANRRHKRNR